MGRGQLDGDRASQLRCCVSMMLAPARNKCTAAAYRYSFLGHDIFRMLDQTPPPRSRRRLSVGLIITRAFANGRPHDDNTA